jgi:acyl-CoA thioester hydrolase
MGHVNNAVYLSYFEEARIRFFNEIVEEDWDWSKTGIILAKNEVEYLAPIYHGDRLLIDVSIKEMRNKSMTVTYRFWNGKEELCAKGSSILVTFDHAAGKTIPIPELWRERFTENKSIS